MGLGVRWRGEGTLGGFDLRSCSKKSCFWALSVKLQHIGRPWMNVFVRVLQKFAKKLESLFRKFNQFSWIYWTTVSPLFENKNGL